MGIHGGVFFPFQFNGNMEYPVILSSRVTKTTNKAVESCVP